MEPFKKILRTPSAFVLVITAVIALIGVIIQNKTSKEIALIPINATHTAEASLTSIPNSNMIFNETFDDNKLGWEIGDGTDVDFIVSREIKDGKYYRRMEMNDKSDGNYGTVPIPNVIGTNFCLIFDTKKVDGTSKDAGIVVIARATNYNSDSEERSYYFIGLYEEGKGLIYLNPKSGETRQIGAFNNSLPWSDNLVHTVAVSLQDNILEIIDWQTKISLYKMTIASSDLLSDTGNIRIGTELIHPNDNITIELDNIVIYNRCPQ